MASLQFGDTIKFGTSEPIELKDVIDVVPIKYNPIDDQWIVCAQTGATHMLIVIDTNIGVKNLVIEIGKCGHLYLLADALVD